MTPEILRKLFQSLDGSLVDTRFMAMALLAFAGFLRFHELAILPGGVLYISLGGEVRHGPSYPDPV